MKLEEIKVGVLCGGKGVRLKPLTSLIPKALVLLRDKPIVQHSLDLYSKQGLKDFTLCIGYKGEIIEEYFNSVEDKPYNISYSKSGEDAGMLKRIYDLKDKFDRDIIITYGDTINNIDFQDLLKFHENNKSQATIVSREIENPFGLLDIQKNKVRKFEEKPMFTYYIGTMVLNKKVFDYMGKELLDKKDGSGVILFFKKLMDLGLLHAYLHKGKELTFNTRAQMLDAEENIIDYYNLPEKNGLGK